MTRTTRKALFVTHDTGLYGASRSLQLLLRNLPDVEIDLMVNRRLSGRLDEKDIRARFGDRIRKIVFHHLPFDQVFKGRELASFSTVPKWVLREMLWRLEKRTVERFIAAGDYDFVHLNSLTLHRLICERHQFIVHVREILEGPAERVGESLRRAQGVIFIDAATDAPFASLPLANRIVLNNPIDMTGLADLDVSGNCYGVDAQQHCIFSLIGKIVEDKGVLFVIEAFRRVSGDRCRLLILGRGRGSYSRDCETAARGDPRIIFAGEDADIVKAFRISDYVIRGEAYPCVGRTVYEGLYAGCEVIVPGVSANLDMFFETSAFAEKIHFYPPRDPNALQLLLAKLSTRKVADRALRTNITEYVASFEAFVGEALMRSISNPAVHGSPQIREHNL